MVAMIKIPKVEARLRNRGEVVSVITTYLADLAVF